MDGWNIYLGHPADRPISARSPRCSTPISSPIAKAERLRSSRWLGRPKGIAPVVSADGILTLDLIPD